MLCEFPVQVSRNFGIAEVSRASFSSHSLPSMAVVEFGTAVSGVSTFSKLHNTAFQPCHLFPRCLDQAPPDLTRSFKTYDFWQVVAQQPQKICKSVSGSYRNLLRGDENYHSK